MNSCAYTDNDCSQLGERESSLTLPPSCIGNYLGRLARKKFFSEVNPSCGRWLALARRHRGGSPRTFQRAASSPRGAQATPHPGKRNDRAPPPPASPHRAAPRRASPRLALQQRTRTRTHAPALAPRERSNPPSEFRTRSQKVPTRTANRFDHRRWRFMKGCQEQCMI